MKTAFLWFAATRVLLIATLLVADRLPVYRGGAKTPLVWNEEGKGPSLFVSTRALDAWSRHDGTYYLAIAALGYEPPPLTGLVKEGFLPGYPLAVRAVQRALASVAPSLDLRHGMVLAAWLASTGASAMALACLVALARGYLGAELATRVGVAFAVLPLGFLHSATCSEGLFLAATTGAILAMERDRPVVAGVLGALAGTTRVFGVVYALPLLVLAWTGPAPSGDRRARVLAIAFVPCGLLLALWYEGLSTGDPFTYFAVQERFGHQHFPTLRGVLDPFRRAELSEFEAARKGAQVLALLVGLGLTSVLVAARRRIPLVLSLTTAGLIALPVLADSIISLPRYLVGTFPLYFALGLVVPKGRLGVGLAAGSALAQAALFLTWEAHWPIVI